jgi:hypothetical protein
MPPPIPASTATGQEQPEPGGQQRHAGQELLLERVAELAGPAEVVDAGAERGEHEPQHQPEPDQGDDPADGHQHPPDPPAAEQLVPRVVVALDPHAVVVVLVPAGDILVAAGRVLLAAAGLDGPVDVAEGVPAHRVLGSRGGHGDPHRHRPDPHLVPVAQLDPVAPVAGMQPPPVDPGAVGRAQVGQDDPAAAAVQDGVAPAHVLVVEQDRHPGLPPDLRASVRDVEAGAPHPAVDHDQLGCRRRTGRHVGAPDGGNSGDQA